MGYFLKITILKIMESILLERLKLFRSLLKVPHGFGTFGIVLKLLSKIFLAKISIFR